MGRGGSLVGRYRHLESDASCYREPVEVTEERRGHVGGLRQVWMRCRGLMAAAGSPARSEMTSEEGSDLADVVEGESLARPISFALLMILFVLI